MERRSQNINMLSNRESEEIDFRELESHLAELGGGLNGVNNDSPMVFLGNTGMGKSTTFAYLMSSELIITEDKNGSSQLCYNAEGARSPIGGNNSERSETLRPEMYQDIDNSVSYIDCLGFFNRDSSNIDVVDEDDNSNNNNIMPNL